MALIKLINLKASTDLEEAVRTLLEHDGRFWIGTSPADREEIDRLQAIQHIVDFRKGKGQPRTIYLTPAPKPRYVSRAKQWEQACNEASNAHATLAYLQADAWKWLEKQRGRITPEVECTLEQIGSLRLDSMQQTLDTASSIEYPKGF